ncbi:Winged helix-turn-helix DNA-binding [Nocardioides terrae]|uniref:Winged helix-turn-helix DNA-binding n=1 Tax=Nocardioides terrae TaxID=574651 RepID=A0A1I1L260_9ACTN|nr:SatD family protein [Nocardioides terrae]SFC67071.1 Winged helix-turn-helix DNA-binding [Nocardioides terrae]
MTQMKVALIGDLVASREAGERAKVHARLAAALDRVNTDVPAAVPLRVTVGDEYQGVYDHLGPALQATLRLRLALLPHVDARHGVGRGSITVLSEQPRVEDGPAWWSARQAIESVETEERRAALRGLRTAYAAAEDTRQDTGDAGGPDPAAVNAALTLRDQLLHGVGPESLSVLAGMLAGMTQKDIAAELGVTASAVSQRVRRDGLGALVRADELLGGLR